MNNSWTKGPSLNEKRAFHSCFYDKLSNSVFTVSGYSDSRRHPSRQLATTEKWNLSNNKWEPTSNLTDTLLASAAAASKSREYIGFVAGGISDERATSEVWGLRRSDEQWIQMEQSLNIGRHSHSMVNIAANEIPGC